MLGLLADLLAQAANPPGGGPSTLTTAFLAALGSGVIVALINWRRDLKKDQAAVETANAQRKGIVEDVNQLVWERTKAELERSNQEILELRQELEAVRERERTLELRVREMEERAHEEKSSAFKGLLEAIPDAIIQAGQYGLIKSVNEPAAKMFGYTVREMIARPITDLMPARYQAAHREAFARAISTGHGAVIDSDHPIRVNALHADGHEFEIALRLSIHEKCFTGVIRLYYAERNGGSLPLLDYPAD